MEKKIAFAFSSAFPLITNQYPFNGETQINNAFKIEISSEKYFHVTRLFIITHFLQKKNFFNQ